MKAMKSILALSFCLVLTFGIVACGGGGGGGTTTTGGDNASVVTTQSTLPIGDANCPNGGVSIDVGIDDNGNSVLDASEVDSTQFVCNGADGIDGTDGVNGTNGVDGTNGFNGTDGVNGTNGVNGADGLTALVSTSPADISNCPAGGTLVEAGIDADSNGTLDPGEADPSLTSYICDGADGTVPVNTAPVADAGPDQNADKGFMVTLDGSGSFDADPRNTVDYTWSFVLMPPRSTAVLNDIAAESPTFTPDIGGDYVLSLTVGDGLLYSTPDYVTITARSWGTAELVEEGDGAAADPEVAFDADGNAMAVWAQYDGAFNSIYASRYDALKGSWEGAEVIDAGDSNAYDPEVAFDAGGNAMAVWQQYSGPVRGIYAGRYFAGAGWAGLTKIDANVGDAYEPKVAVEASGKAIAVWQEDDSTGTFTNDIYANIYNGASWAGPEIIDAGIGSSTFPEVSVNDNGRAVAVWIQNGDICANIYNGSGWAGAVVIDEGVYSASDAHVSIGANGNAVAVWRQYDGSKFDIYANVYGRAGWSGAVEIDAGDYDAFIPQVAVDASGNAIAVWEQDDVPYDNIYANIYNGTSWTGAEIIDAGDNNADYTQVALDAGGNAFVVWRQATGNPGLHLNIYVNRYEAGTGWGTTEVLDKNYYFVYPPQVAVSEGGNAAVVWQQSDGTSDSIYANIYE